MQGERLKTFNLMILCVLSRGTGFTKVFIQLTPSRGPLTSDAGQFCEAGL